MTIMTHFLLLVKHDSIYLQALHSPCRGLSWCGGECGRNRSLIRTRKTTTPTLDGVLQVWGGWSVGAGGPDYNPHRLYYYINMIPFTLLSGVCITQP